MATSLKIDDELKARIKQLARLRQRSAHWIMHEAIARSTSSARKRAEIGAVREGSNEFAKLTVCRLGPRTRSDQAPWQGVSERCIV